MAWSKKKKREFLEETKWLTLLHMYLMVSKKMDPKRTGKGQYIFFEMMLSDDIKALTGIEDSGKISYVQTLMRKQYSDGVSAQLYDNIYGLLDKSNMKTREQRVQFLHKQYEKLKALAKENSEEYASKLWGAMDASHEDVDASYMEIFQKRSPWLFKDHEKELAGFDDDRIYKLVAVAIAISLNQKTSITDTTTDNLDNLCKEFLYAGPSEELPEFTLRDIFDALFPEEDIFAVKRARDDDYVMVKRDDLTDCDQLCILLPWLDARYDFHPNSEEAAKALLDNNAVGKETADRLRGFFLSFSERPNPIWRNFVAHLKESLVKCRHAKDLKNDNETDEDIGAELKVQLDTVTIPGKSKSYFNLLSKKRPWYNIAHDKFWEGNRVDISLPQECKKIEDADQIYQYIAAYVLIALCCVKADGDATPDKRKVFKSALMQIINDPNSTEQELVMLRAANAELKADNVGLNRVVEKQNSTIAALVSLLGEVLNDMHLSSSIVLKEYIENFCQSMGITLEQIPGIEDLINGYDDSKTRRLITDSADWGNGGIK